MHDKMMKMLGKKRDLSEHEKSAKMDVMKEMRDEAAKAMHGKLDGLKKVSVMSDSPQGLKEGLDKAKSMMSAGGKVSDEEMDNMREKAEDDQSNSFGPEDSEEAPDDLNAHMEEDEESPEHEASESAEEESKEHEDMSPDELDQEIAKLQEMKKAKMADGGPVLDPDKVRQFQQGFFGKK